jgi:hypothetical protein
METVSAYMYTLYLEYIVFFMLFAMNCKNGNGGKEKIGRERCPVRLGPASAREDRLTTFVKEQ